MHAAAAPHLNMLLQMTRLNSHRHQIRTNTMTSQMTSLQGSVGGSKGQKGGPNRALAGQIEM